MKWLCTCSSVVLLRDHFQPSGRRVFALSMDKHHQPRLSAKHERSPKSRPLSLALGHCF